MIGRTDACLRAWWKHNGVLIPGQRERLDVGVFQFQSIFVSVLRWVFAMVDV